MIILDEPTNHLDIESREALVEALTEYGGAVILVSHDPHLVELVADRLWLVKDGRVHAVRGRHGRLPPAASLRARRRARSGAREDEAQSAARRRPRAERGAAARRGRAMRGAGARSSRRCAPRSTAGSPTRCSTPAATPRRSARLQKKRAEVEDGARPRRGALARGARAAGGGRRAGLMSLEVLVTTFVTLFVIIDPIGLAPLFVALTRGDDRRASARGRAARGRSSPSACSRSSASSASAADGDRHRAAGVPHLRRPAPVPDRRRHAVRAAHRAARAPRRRGSDDGRPTRRCSRWRRR